MTTLPTNSMQKWLFRGAALLLATTIGALAFYIFCSYQAFFNSDAAIANILAEEIVRAGDFFPKTWWYVNNDLWVFYKHLLLIPWVMAGENSFFAHGVSVFLVVLVTMTVLALLLRNLGLSKTAALMGCVVVGLGYSPMYLREVYGEAAYTWYFAFILSFLLLPLQAARPDSGRISRQALFALLLVLVYLVVIENPVRFLVYYIAPFFGAFLVLLYAERQALLAGGADGCRARFFPKIIPAAAVLAALLLGAFSHDFLLARLNHAGGANQALLVPVQQLLFHVAYSLLGFLNFIGAEWGDKVVLASAEGVFSLLKLGFYPVALVLPACYGWKNILRLERGQRYFLLLSYLGFGLIFFLYSVSTLHDGAFAARNNIRYIIPYLMMILVCPVVVWRFFPQVAKGVLVVTLVLAIGGSWKNISPEGWRETAKGQADLIAALKSRGLSHGYAPYWDSHVYTVLSKGTVRIRPIDIDWRGVGLCVWLSSDRWYEKGYADGKVFFLVSNDKLENWKDGSERLSLPQPAEVFTHDGYTVFVFSANPLIGIGESGRACREGDESEP
ncbi:hypothetical protein [Thiovibrio frasassiensis]|uniref:Uncharacterized protein n=1 Tax=Thiovibrio frasassiensis TaxID=2984131 RepID=A0A9X4MEH1_9BACT|nr:hypothetical protein [Thiovibrio frasassiensis]MDG4475137.1 hypothetical protein [Thiovibrio frasassiensis]